MHNFGGHPRQHYTERRFNTAPEENTWRSLAYGNGTYVAVAATGTNRVMTSPDGSTWTSQSAAADRQWVSVAYGNGVFVAVSFNSIPGQPDIMTSPDGTTWTVQSAGSTISWNQVVYANGMFVALPNSSSEDIRTSPNGVTWTAQSSSRTIQLSSVTYGNGMFVAVAFTGTGGRVMTSPDGITWTPQSAAESNFWASVVYANGTFVSVAANGTNRVMTSVDGASWTAYAAVEDSSWLHVNYINGRFIALAGDGTNQIMTSISGHDLGLGNPNFSSNSIAPGGASPSVLANSTVLSSGNPVDPDDYTLSLINDGGLSGVVLNPDGTLSIPVNASGGTYTLTYTACENIFPDYCEQASVTLAVQGATPPQSGGGQNSNSANNGSSGNNVSNSSLAQTGISPLLFTLTGVLLILASGLTWRYARRTSL